MRDDGPPPNDPLFRPPAEADSLILQTDIGCPYNRCRFCGMYRDVPFRRRPPDEVRALIAAARHGQPETTRVFLADGDAMARPYAELAFILRELDAAFPALTRVNAYATGRAIAAKTDDKLRRLRALRLQTLYLGLESGDEATLTAMAKGETAAAMVVAGQRAQVAGLRLSVMVLLGLGGAARSATHAAATAAALNALQPRLLSALRVVPVPGTPLGDDVQAGRFGLPTEHAVVAELRALVADLRLTGTVFRANHSSNVVPLEARLPRDQGALLATLDRLLAGNRLDRRGPGRTPLWL